MRVFAFAVCTVVLFASDEASAACSKGLLWPYVRNPGDCLTDEEIRTGTIGIYNGPVNATPDVSAIKIAPPAQNQSGVSSPASGGNPTPSASSRGLLDTIGLTGLFGGGGNSGAAVTTPSGETASFSCNRGYFWPFYRSPGDCLTDIEKKNGHTGVYGGGSGLTPVSVGPSTVTATPPSGQVTAAPAAAADGTAGAASCHKGLLWPFVRDAGDCPTDAEKKNGQSSVAPAAFTSNTVTAASAAARPPAAPSATAPVGDNAAAGCRKGLLWPFVRSTGDCATDDDKKIGRSNDSAAAAPSTVSASMATTAPTQAVSSSVSGTPGPSGASDADAGCHKGAFWPFIRGAADCPTDDDKKIGRSTFDPAAVKPASTTTSAPGEPSSTSGVPASSGPAPASESDAGCKKGLLWPFVRGAGDCPTDDQRARSH